MWVSLKQRTHASITGRALQRAAPTRLSSARGEGPLDSKQHDLDDYAKNLIRHKARQMIGKYGLAPDDYNDLRQDMILDLLTRLPKFNPDKAGLNTFVTRLVDRKASSIIRHRRQAKRDFRCKAGSLEDMVETKDGGTVERGETISQDECDLRSGTRDRTESERIDMQVDVSIALADLPPELRALATRLMIDTIAQAARDLGVPRSTIYETGIARLRKAFIDKRLHEYL
jgi:RNA polymerase sigma-70 factor (ECF subfamily)